MKTLETLNSYFNGPMKAGVEALDSQRKSIILKAWVGVVFVVILMITSFVVATVLLEKSEAPYIFGWYALFLLVYPTGAWVVYRAITNNKQFHERFKVEIIAKLVNFLNESLVYDSRKHMPAKTFSESKLFLHPPHRYVGDDYVSGKLSSGIELRFSELKVDYKPHASKWATEAERATKNEFEKLFRGLFFVLDTQVTFPTVFLLPHDHNLPFEKLGFARNELQTTQLSNQAFNEYYKIHTSDPKSTRQLLVETIQQELSNFARSTKDKVLISFIGSRVTIAVSHEHDLFEPSLYKPLTDFDAIKEYYEVLHPAMTVFETLNEMLAQSGNNLDGGASSTRRMARA